LFLSGEQQERWEEFAMETLAYLSQDAETRQKYALREKAIRDERSRLLAAEEQGLARGEKVGRVAGLKEGLKEGKRQIAANMLKAGMAPERVAELTELSLDEVLMLRENEI
jgi:predicted transposase/invertase (TIGR01784 family)